MTEPLSHSARPASGVPAQSYTVHVRNVMELAEKNAKMAGEYYRKEGERLIHAVRLAAEFHDLGKLDAVNQRVLETNTGKMLNHVDAGVSALLREPFQNGAAALLVYSHHQGLPDYVDTKLNPRSFLRDRQTQVDEKPLMEYSDSLLSTYQRIHREYVSSAVSRAQRIDTGRLPDNSAMLFRIALSCLVDADHEDTARNYRQAIPYHGPKLRPADRLNLLNAHIEFLSKARMDDRTALRTQVYEACRDADPQPSMYACDSPAGSGKTTAVMAHLLRAAGEKGLRRIFVVLPFTNIIDQSVETYRRALVALGERAEDVVGAHHHRAEFEDIESRQFTFLWHSPIVVTTAVQFFETLASDHPASLRKLHQLPGSAIFIDEAHAALPARLWPQAWRWLRKLQSDWGCHIILGSGSLSRFWELEEFSDPPASIPELVSSETRVAASKYESNRVQYHSRYDVLGLEELVNWVRDMKGPRLLIVNTVQSGAAIAAEIARKFGKKFVEHLSTALCPRDRKNTLERVRSRLQNEHDHDWILVATSCVEAGVDLSFRTGIRERCSLNSLVQIGGRVNRGGEHGDSGVWDFRLRHEGLLRSHPAFDASARVLGDLIERHRVGPQYCTEAMRNEIRSDGLGLISKKIVDAEKNLKFPFVANEFNVIDSKTVTAIIDEELVRRLEDREKVDRNLIQAMSVQIWGYRKEELALRPIAGFPGMYGWSLLYNDFLGYMAGVLQVEAHKQQGGSFV